MATKIKVTQIVIDCINKIHDKLANESFAKVAILASSDSTTIDSLYFICHRSGGCEWQPKLESRAIAKAICNVLKDKNIIKGLVSIPAQRKDTRVSSWFGDMIYKGWRDKDYVFIVRGRYRILSYSWNKYRELKSSKIKIVKQRKHK